MAKNENKPCSTYQNPIFQLINTIKFDFMYPIHHQAYYYCGSATEDFLFTWTPISSQKNTPHTYFVVVVSMALYFPFLLAFFRFSFREEALSSSYGFEQKKSRAINILSRKPNLMLEIRQCDIDHQYWPPPNLVSGIYINQWRIIVINVRFIERVGILLTQ